ncbi:MAG TPA: ankyrin repeat domain-containing protein [Terriglobales bacterium]|nr:ankyrin repeat domain-containing protein [Terriglobales bacterium]
MPERRLPVRPDLIQLKHQAKNFLRDIRRSDPAAIAEFHQHHPDKIDPTRAKLADAQLALARAYEAPSWPRLVQSCQIIDAIWQDDPVAVREMILKNQRLLHENALVRPSNWGPPMSYAANLGRDRIIRLLHDLGAKDHAQAMNRAALQSQIGAARLLHSLMGSPRITDAQALRDPGYTLSVSGTALMLELGAPVTDTNGNCLAPVHMVLETDSRKPDAKHQILEMYVQHGLDLPDTPTMALHRGRTDLLEAHLRRDSNLLRRTFSHEEIYPPELGCHDQVLATQGTPLSGTTLLHLCADYDELEIARWLIERGADVNAKADTDADGFGGHTALFGTVVSQPNFWVNHLGKPDEAPMTCLLLDHGADTNVRASLRKKLHPGYGEDTLHEYRDVTPLLWGKRFHRRVFVSREALRLLEERGGRE